MTPGPSLLGSSATCAWAVSGAVSHWGWSEVARHPIFSEADRTDSAGILLTCGTRRMRPPSVKAFSTQVNGDLLNRALNVSWRFCGIVCVNFFTPSRARNTSTRKADR